MNIVILIGNLTKDPEVKYSQNQTAIAKFTIATNRYSKDGENQADFIRVTAFGKQAELVESYLSKGNKVGVEGRIQTGSYEGKDGKTVYTTDVIASRIEFLEKRGSVQRTDPQSPPAEIPEGFSSFADDDDDVPF